MFMCKNQCGINSGYEELLILRKNIGHKLEPTGNSKNSFFSNFKITEVNQ